MTQEPLLCSSTGYARYHMVKRGDSLWRIVRDSYGLSKPGEIQAGVQQIAALNPHLRSPNEIHPGQLVYLPVPLDRFSLSRLPIEEEQERQHVLRAWDGVYSDDRRAASEVGPVLSTAGYLASAGGGGLVGFELLVMSNRESLVRVIDKYLEYQAGAVTRGQYNYFRQKELGVFQERLGPFLRMLFGKKSAHEAIRMKPGGGASATLPVQRQVSRLATAGRYASRGGVVLSFVGLGIACRQIAHADTAKEKDLIAVEALSGTSAGLITGAAVGVFLASNPVGWGVALTIGLGSALVGVAAGRAAKGFYAKHGQELQIAESLHITDVCR